VHSSVWEKIPRIFISKRISISDFNDECLVKQFRFTGAELNEILVVMKFPKSILLDHDYLVTGEEMLLVILRRLVYPSRWYDLCHFLKKSESILSRIFTLGIVYIKPQFGWRIASLDGLQSEFDSLSNAISEKGSPLENLIGFIDGTPREICRPG